MLRRKGRKTIPQFPLQFEGVPKGRGSFKSDAHRQVGAPLPPTLKLRRTCKEGNTTIHHSQVEAPLLLFMRRGRVMS